MWKWLEDKIAAFITLLCALFDTPPENMDDGRRGNLPPAEGGVSSMGDRQSNG